MVCVVHADSFTAYEDLPVSIWAFSSIVIQLLPRLSGKAEHLFVSTELKMLCELGEELHGVVFEPITDDTNYDEFSGNLIWTCFSLACRSISALNIF